MSQHLEETLKKITQYLSSMEASNQDKEALSGLLTDLQQQIDEPESELESLANQVDELATSFEAEHPTLAGILKNLMTTLGNMGV